MNKRRNVLTFISLFVLPLLLFQFQNCGSTAGMHAGAQDSGGVKIVDDFNKAEIQFAQSTVEIQDEVPATDVSGLCSHGHNGAHLRWAVWAGEKSEMPLLAGASDCQGGQFAIELSRLDLLVCGTSHLIVVEGDWGGSTFAHVTRRCQPLASQEIVPPEQSPVGTSCALEYSPGSAAADRCVQVCYRDSKVVFSQPQEPTQCSSLAAGLAGQ